MARKKQKDVLFCTVCRTNEISAERITHGAVTCSKECARRLRTIRRRLVDRVKCRYCGAPSTLEERREFKKWRLSRGEGKRGRKLGSKNKPKANGQAEFTEMIHVN